MTDLTPKTKRPPAVPCCRRTSLNGINQLIFETPAGQRITLQDGAASILIEDSNGNSVTLDAAGITVRAAAKVTLQASLLEISASLVTVNAGQTAFSGVLQADTIVASNILKPGGGTW